MYLLLCLFAFFDSLALRNRDVPVQQLEIPETVDEEARRIAYNIAHNKAFINLDLRKVMCREHIYIYIYIYHLFPLIFARGG